MFTSPRPNLYESSEGFSVEVLGRTGLCYREGDRRICIDSEVLSGPIAIGIYRSSIHAWDSPLGTQLVTNEEATRIIDNIETAFKSQGFQIVVI